MNTDLDDLREEYLSRMQTKWRQLYAQHPSRVAQEIQEFFNECEDPFNPTEEELNKMYDLLNKE